MTQNDNIGIYFCKTVSNKKIVRKLLVMGKIFNGIAELLENIFH